MISQRNRNRSLYRNSLARLSKSCTTPCYPGNGRKPHMSVLQSRPSVWPGRELNPRSDRSRSRMVHYMLNPVVYAMLKKFQVPASRMGMSIKVLYSFQRLWTWSPLTSFMGFMKGQRLKLRLYKTTKILACILKTLIFSIYIAFLQTSGIWVRINMKYRFQTSNWWKRYQGIDRTLTWHNGYETDKIAK